MIRWGILGAGRIAYRFARSLNFVAEAELAAISVRSREKGKAFADEFNVERCYLSHDELLRDPEIDAIYLALPHGLHEEWAVKALQAHKPVLCEKPAALNGAQMRHIAETAKECGCLFMEAMKCRFVPAYREIKDCLASGTIGDIIGVDASLCFELPADMQNTYHRQPGQGGALLDAGIYCASWLEDFCRQEIKPQKTYADLSQGVDMYVEAFLTDGRMQLRLETGFDRQKPRRCLVTGTKGTLLVNDLHRPQGYSVKIGDSEEEHECLYAHDDFYGEISHFQHLLKEQKTESDIMPFSASIRCAELLDSIRRDFTDYDEKDLQIIERQPLFGIRHSCEKTMYC